MKVQEKNLIKGVFYKAKPLNKMNLFLIKRG